MPPHRRSAWRVNLSNSDNVTYFFTPYVEGLTVSRQPTVSTAKPAASKWMRPAT
ncbi:hypothetical protein ABAC460_04850 [Asticcacaulis sp. AC460]|uniref:hypothetical protein n=1 Tax=Asticcacaulis sp. AC460 TaxID=1282360 RepID=UPI0003C4018A|nr:hypothetical protein [Asticcacaulis sp. AC460]ESQ92222.1 hypothetical protein ABAC460_04850 [Asticcacaulis sp. AC460]